MHQVPPHARPTPCHAFSQLPTTHHLAHARRHACARPHTRAGRARARARCHIGDGAGGRSRRLRPPAGSRPQLRGARRPSGSRASRRRSTRWWRSRGPALTPMAGKARKDKGASNMHAVRQIGENTASCASELRLMLGPRGGSCAVLGQVRGALSDGAVRIKPFPRLEGGRGQRTGLVSNV